MTTGYSGTYAIGGVDFLIQPTSGGWLPREVIGIDGNGHPVYAMFREFETRWQLISQDEVYQLQNWYNTVGNTGSVVADLPRYGSPNSEYEFFSYTGCVLQEPNFGIYFERHSSEITMLITKIKT